MSYANFRGPQLDKYKLYENFPTHTDKERFNVFIVIVILVSLKLVLAAVQCK